MLQAEGPTDIAFGMVVIAIIKRALELLGQELANGAA